MQIKSCLFLKRLIFLKNTKLTRKNTNIHVIRTLLQQFKSVQGILKTATPFHPINCDHSVLTFTLSFSKYRGLMYVHFNCLQFFIFYLEEAKVVSSLKQKHEHRQYSW